MNGGSQGALHISAPWGDTQLAGQFGSGAAFYGSEYAAEVFRTMGEFPEPFGLPAAADTAQSRGNASCDDLCRQQYPGNFVLETICRNACYIRKPGSGGNPVDFKSWATLSVIGAGLIIVGALAFTK